MGGELEGDGTISLQAYSASSPQISNLPTVEHLRDGRAPHKPYPDPNPSPNPNPNPNPNRNPNPKPNPKPNPEGNPNVGSSHSSVPTLARPTSQVRPFALYLNPLRYSCGTFKNEVPDHLRGVRLRGNINIYIYIQKSH